LKYGLKNRSTAILQLLRTRLSFSMIFSILLHAFLLFGIALVMPDPRSSANFMQPLEVVLVNSKSKSKPLNADAQAQHNLDGGGNTAENRRAKSPLPSIRDDLKFTPEQRARRVAELEQESKRMLTKLKSDYNVVQPAPKKQNTSAASNGEDLVQKALEIARLEAQINKNWDAYQKMPRRKFIGARTQEYRFAQYIEDWRVKVERIGNLNYPEQARREKIFGKLQLSVSINKDGSVESVEVSKSSGKRLLDAAAMRIVKLAAPYAPLPPNITRDTDILTITRTWSFTSSDTLESE
jgi:periplasmic protein TonB